MKKYFLFVSACIFAVNLSAQQILPQTISSAGNSFAGASLQVDQTVGEMALVSTVSSPQLIITQGFLQPPPLWLTNSPQTVVQNILFFPNPTSGAINIQFKNFESGNVLLTLYNSIGQLIHSEQVAIPANENFLLDLSGFPNGIYNLQILQLNQTSVITKNLKIQLIP